MGQIALDGGMAVRETWLAYGSQTISEADVAAVSESLRRSWITRGPMVEAFERALAEFVGASYAVAFSSGTAALHAMMALKGVSRDSKVGIPANTFAATANSVLYCQGRPVFLDIESKTLNLNPAEVSGELTHLVAVDFAGNPCHYDALKPIAQKLGISLMSDAAHSLGATYKGQGAGSLAEASIFSFHPIKSMTTAEGGAVMVWDKAEAQFLKEFRNHGLTTLKDRPWLKDQRMLGFNYHLTEMQAALGCSQLKQLRSWIERRREIAKTYGKKLAQYSEFCELPQESPGASSAWHLYPIRLHLERLQVDRDQFLRALWAENIGAMVHYQPVYWHSYYRQHFPETKPCEVAEREFLRELSLPIFPGMSEQDIADVVKALEKLFDAYGVT